MSAAQTTSSDLLYHCTNTVTQIDVVVKPCGLESDVGLEAARLDDDVDLCHCVSAVIQKV